MIRILLPIDGTPHALDAVRHALALRASGLEIQTTLLNVQDPPHLYEVVLAPDAHLIEEASAEAGEHALAEARALLEAAGLACEELVVRGDVAHQVAEQADLQGCDLIVMATLSHGALLGRWHDSVAQAVVRHSRVPVTLVPPVVQEVDAADLADLAAQNDAADGASAQA